MSSARMVTLEVIQKELCVPYFQPIPSLRTLC